MSQLPISKLETHEAGTIGLNAIIQANWEQLEDILDPALGSGHTEYAVLWKALVRGTGTPSLGQTVRWNGSKPVFAYSNIFATTTKTTTYTATNEDSRIFCNATSGAFTVHLPAASAHAGLVLVVTKTDASGNAVTVDGDGAETINGATTQSLASQYSTIKVCCNGTAWFIE